MADAYAALRFLAADSRIDADRIAIVGFSFGGEIAHLTALTSLRAALEPDGPSFAAHVAYYPAGVYAPAAEVGAYTGAPILMLLGDNDDNLPIAKVESLLNYAVAMGAPAPIEVKSYSGGLHAWTVSSLGAPRRYPQYASTRGCPFILLSRSGPGLLVDGRSVQFDPGALERCVRSDRGYTMGYDAELRARSTKDMLAFLVRHLRP